ncbi:hypothetical protein ASZ78_011793, partial [Callipepla squamata]
MALDQMLHMLVFVHPTASIGEELQSVFQVQRIVMAIHRSRKLITEERAQRTIQNTFPWLAASDPRATTLSLLRCSHTCDKDTWELWEMALSSAGVVPWMVQELLRLLEVAPLGQETEIGTLPLAAAMALHKILQHSQYGPQVCLFVLELFVALIFQMVSSTSLKPLEVTAIMEDPSTPTSASRILVKVVHKLLQCADLDRLVQAIDRHKLWRQLLGPATWQDGLRSLARVMVMECQVDSVCIFSHVQKLLWYHQLQWREVPAMVFYMELHRCLELQEENGRAEKIFRTHIHSEHSESQELAMRGLRNLYTGRMHLLLPDVLTWLQDTRADIKLQATQLLRDIVAHHPRHVQDVLSQLAVPLTSCFNE